MYKKFDKKLFEENDNKARNIAINHFNKRGYVVLNNENKYGPDLLLYKNNNLIGYIECEIKNVWKGNSFPYPNVQFPERKAKYVKEYKLPTIFFMLNNECSMALIVKGKDIISSSLVEVPNKYLKKNEMFFQVDLDKVRFITIKE